MNKLTNSKLMSKMDSFFNLLSFEHHCVEENNLFLLYFGREFDGRVEFVVSLFNIHARIIVVPQPRSVLWRKYTLIKTDTNGEHTMRKFIVNSLDSLYWLPYIFQCKIATLDIVPSTLEKIPSTLDKKAVSWICCERFEFAVGDLNLLWVIWICCERFLICCEHLVLMRQHFSTGGGLLVEGGGWQVTGSGLLANSALLTIFIVRLVKHTNRSKISFSKCLKQKS